MSLKEISIITYESKYADDFKQLNLEWLDKYGLTETPDLIMINNPQQEILDTGGALFLARSGETIVGSAALIRETALQYELVKMAVLPAFQGMGISKILIEICIETAKNAGAKRIYLHSNSQLTTAIALYEKYGFQHIPVQEAHYLTADVMMELFL
jgi:ribosomal protein S18 acetylase RimI-like enzyme